MSEKHIFDITMVAPTINNNGDNGEALLERHKEARRAIEAAIKAMREIAPHGRNYQTQPDSCLRFASEAYHLRLQALQEISSDVYGVAIAIFGQIER